MTAKNVRVHPETCSYTGYAYDTRTKKGTERFRVRKPYSEVTREERDPNVYECTICQEDQVTIDPKSFGVSLPPIRICHLYADKVREALNHIVQSRQFQITKLEGYRPGKTRGPVDKNGRRTQWSQHSFGTAIDINADFNAIYSNCGMKLTGRASEVKLCKKGIGGDWNPEENPSVTIVKDGIVYREFTQFWNWGGEIDGMTKDTMHFSVTGY